MAKRTSNGLTERQRNASWLSDPSLAQDLGGIALRSFVAAASTNRAKLAAAVLGKPVSVLDSLPDDLAAPLTGFKLAATDVNAGVEDPRIVEVKFSDITVAARRVMETAVDVHLMKVRSTRSRADVDMGKPATLPAVGGDA